MLNHFCRFALINPRQVRGATLGKALSDRQMTPHRPQLDSHRNLPRAIPCPSTYVVAARRINSLALTDCYLCFGFLPPEHNEESLVRCFVRAARHAQRAAGRLIRRLTPPR